MSSPAKHTGQLSHPVQDALAGTLQVQPLAQCRHFFFGEHPRIGEAVTNTAGTVETICVGDFPGMLRVDAPDVQEPAIVGGVTESGNSPGMEMEGSGEVGVAAAFFSFFLLKSM
jgi:hypothetical protein